MGKDNLILVINPGSTTTKIAVFRDEAELMSRSLAYDAGELSRFSRISEQYDFRLATVRTALSEASVDVSELTIVLARGGLLKPVSGGIYEVSSAMREDLRAGRYGEHASNLGGLIGAAIAESVPCRAYVADPVVVDELDDIARVSGNPHISRRSIFHALNQKSVAYLVAKRLGRPYQSLNLIVAHLGGGISVGIHRQGRVVDVNNALEGEGPFSPERSGGVPAGALVDMCLGGRFTAQQLKRQIAGEGGLVAYLGTNDAKLILKRISEGDSKARLIYDAMAYQIAKEIGQLSTVVSGKIDAIILTGGLANESTLMDKIRDRVSFLGDVFVFPGEREMEALRDAALRVIRGEESTKIYS